MTAGEIILTGVIWLIVAGFICFLLAIIKYYSTPIMGDFEINLDPTKDVDAIYGVKLESHPLTWKKRKTVRFRVVIHEAKK